MFLHPFSVLGACVRGKIFLSILLSFLVLNLKTRNSWAESQGEAPIFAGRIGISNLNFSVGSIFTNKSLNSMCVLNPTVLWNFSSVRSRLGFHFMVDFLSSYSFTPISGIGLSAYYYPMGLSSVYEILDSDTLIQKSISGPFVSVKITPVNMNINASKDQVPFNSAVAFAATMVELATGVGYDYALRPNMILAVDIQYRFASAQESVSSNSISYSGTGINFGFVTSYH